MRVRWIKHSILFVSMFSKVDVYKKNDQEKETNVYWKRRWEKNLWFILYKSILKNNH